MQLIIQPNYSNQSVRGHYQIIRNLAFLIQTLELTDLVPFLLPRQRTH